MPRGHFIVFEGPDNSGKSTQVKKISEYFNSIGTDTKSMAFPDRTTKIGKKIDKYLRSEIDLDDMEIHRLFSENRWELQDDMKSTLSKGINILCDRYCYSGISYTVAKGYSYKECLEPDIGIIEPDIVIYYDVSMEEAARRRYGKERYENEEFQKRVREAYSLSKKDFKGDWHVITTDGKDVDTVFRETIKVLEGASVTRNTEKGFNLVGAPASGT